MINSLEVVSTTKGNSSTLSDCNGLMLCVSGDDGGGADIKSPQKCKLVDLRAGTLGA